MAIEVLIHIQNSEPILAEIDELPSLQDTLLKVSNPRLRDGKELHYLAVEVPGANLVTSCALGGKQRDELYITTATIDYAREDWQAHPNGGGLFRAEVGVKGLPADSFKG